MDDFINLTADEFDALFEAAISISSQQSLRALEANENEHENSESKSPDGSMCIDQKTSLDDQHAASTKSTTVVVLKGTAEQPILIDEADDHCATNSTQAAPKVTSVESGQQISQRPRKLSLKKRTSNNSMFEQHSINPNNEEPDTGSNSVDGSGDWKEMMNKIPDDHDNLGINDGQKSDTSKQELQPCTQIDLLDSAESDSDDGIVSISFDYQAEPANHFLRFLDFEKDEDLEHRIEEELHHIRLESEQQQIFDSGNKRNVAVEHKQCSETERNQEVQRASEEKQLSKDGEKAEWPKISEHWNEDPIEIGYDDEFTAEMFDDAMLCLQQEACEENVS